MKNKVKYFIMGIIITNLFIGSIALATEGTEIIDVIFNYANLKVNGEYVEVENIYYNDKTYAPIGKIAEMLGKEVGWDEETKTSTITDQEPFTVDEDFILHGCYAIKSFNQFQDISRSKTLSNFDSISFGWSRIDKIDGKPELIYNGHDFYIPEGYDDTLEMTSKQNIPKQLMIYADYSNGYFFNEIFANKEEYIDQIIEVVNGNHNNYSYLQEFEGVTIDFETVRADDQKGFVEFLSLLDEKLEEKKLYVAVPSVYYNGYYDFEGIIDVCDYMILMEHDYYERSLKKEYAGDSVIKQPLSPINKIESGLETLANKIGKDKLNKVLLQVSFDVNGWLVKDGFLYNHDDDEDEDEDEDDSDVVYPIGLDLNEYSELYNNVKEVISDNSTKITDLTHYDEEFQNPYISLYDAEDNINSYIWYENTRSVIEKFKLAEKYDLAGISLWRIGTIPNYMDKQGKELGLDIWDNINDVMDR